MKTRLYSRVTICVDRVNSADFIKAADYQLLKISRYCGPL